MNKIEELRRVLQRINHKSYGMYKNLAGSYDCGRYMLHIDHVQGDPFASPSRLRFEIRKNNHGFPEEYWQDKHRRLALEDQVLRRFNGFLRKMDTTRSMWCFFRPDLSDSVRHPKRMARMERWIMAGVTWKLFR